MLHRAVQRSNNGWRCKRALSSLADSFYTEYSPAAAASADTVTGELLDHSINLKRARPGDLIKVPYEVTVGSGVREMWQAAFYSHDRINTSTPFARGLGLQDQVLPFAMMLYLAGSMSHADAAVVQVAYRNGVYMWPGFAGDTFTKTFRIKSLRSTRDGNKSAYDIVCQLINQRGKVCFRAEKTMMFPWSVPASPEVLEDGDPPKHQLLEHIVNQSDKLAALGGQSLKRLRAGQLIIHSHCRPITLTQSMALSSMARLTHHKHYNTVKYGRDELMVPGGLVLALATSASARDLHEVLHEELLECNFINPLRPGDLMGSLSFISGVETHVNGILEKLTVRTIGIKNMDVRELKGVPLPRALFTTKGLKTKQVEEICSRECPQLSDAIVASVERVIVRQAPKTDVFLL